MRLRFAEATVPAKIIHMSQPPADEPMPEPPTYEAAAARVEEIIRRLDSGEASLNETLELVREGKSLIELCARELEAVGDALEELRLDELVARLGRREPAESVSSWELLAGMPLEIEDYALEPLQATVSSEFERKSTVIHLRGAGEEGIGEDVTYDAVDQEILQAPARTLPLAGRFTLASFAEHLRRARRCSPSRRSARSPRATATGRMSRPRSTSRLRQARHHAARGARARSGAGALRRLAAPRRAAVARAGAPAPSSATRGCASSSTRRAPGMSR